MFCVDAVDIGEGENPQSVRPNRGSPRYGPMPRPNRPSSYTPMSQVVHLPFGAGSLHYRSSTRSSFSMSFCWSKRDENGVESFHFSGEKMETERNQRFVSLDRAIEQNQCLNHVCRIRVSPSSRARPHMVARHATHRKPSI